MAFIKQIKVGNNTYDIHKKVTVTIAAADWTAATIDKTVSGMTVNDIVVVSPAPSSIIGARNSVVYCSAIKANALSFTYSVSKPTAALTFNVLWVQAATTDTDKGAIINTVMGGKIPTGTLNVNSTLSNYDTYLNNVRYINLGAGSLNVSGSAISSVSGSGSVNPGANTISKNSATNVSTGTVTTTKPTSGVYVAVDATTAQGSGNINISASGTAKAGVTSAGYVHNETASSAISKSGTASVTVPAKSAATTYIPITAGTIDVADKTVNPKALTGTWDAANEKYVVSQAKKTGETMQSTVTTAGYVSSTVGTKNTGALTINAPANLEIAKATFTVSGNSVKSNTAGYIPANTNVGAVSTVARAKTTTSTTANTTDAKLTVTASNNQGTGYVTGSNETASDTITLSVSGATVTATSGNDSTKKVSKSVASTNVVEKAGSVSDNTYTQGKVTVDTAGYISAGDKVSGASFANTATTNVTYKDISSTTAAPILVSNDYLYINKGYTDNVKISLAKLVPDGASADLASNKILSGYSAYDNDGKLIAGSIPTITPSITNGTASATANAGTASVTTNPSASASATQTGMTDGVSTTATSYYFTSSASANAGKLTATGGSARAYVTASSATVTKGYVAANATASTTASDTGTKTGNTVTTASKTASDSSTVYLKAATCSVTRDSAPSATIAKNPTATTTASSATTSVTGMKTTTTNTGYSVSASATSGSASAASGYSTASVGAIYDTHTAGYLPNKSKTKIFDAASATATEKTAHSDAKTASETKYIQKGVLSATVDCDITFTPSVSTNMATISKPSSGTEGRDYFSITGSGTTSGDATGSASVSTEGYVKNETATSNSATGTIGSDAKKYVKKATITNNTSGGTSPETINRGKQIKIGAGYNPSDLYYIAEAAPTLSGNAAAADVLYGKKFYSNSYTVHTGTMANQGAKTATLNPEGSYTIPAGYHNGNGKVTARALINQAKSPTAITVGTAITPDSGKDGLSSVTIPSNATITVASNNTLNIAVPPMSSSVVYYDSIHNEGGTNTQLNATVGGGTLNTIDVVGGATTNVNVYNTGILNINRVSGIVHSDDLVASNIRKGSSILGVVGTYAASSTASDIYKAQYAGNISSGWSTYWYSFEGNMGSNWDFTEPLSTPIPQGASVRLKYNEFGPNANSGAGFRVYLVSASGTEQIIANPSAYEASNGPHTSSAISSNIVATKIKVEKFSGAGETVSTYQLLAVEVYVNVPGGYYGVTATSGGSTLADVSSYQYMAVKKATLGNTYTPSTSSQSVKVNGEGWVKTSDTVATIKPISTETQTVNLSLASGNQTVNASSGYYMTSVTINKPSTLVAGNIKNGVTIAGVTGTYSAPPAADPAVKFLGLYLYTQRGSAGNAAVLENVTGCEFAGVNRRFGASAYVGCFGLFAFKGTPTIKPCLFDADGLVIGENSAVPLSDLLNDPDASRTVSLYDLLDGITKYEQNIDYNQIYLAPMALTTNENDWGPSSPYYWQAMGVGDSSSTYVYIKNLGSKCMSLNYND